MVDKWEKDVHMVINQPDKDIPVFEVQPETGVGKVRKLHRNLLHPFVINQNVWEDVVERNEQSDPESDDESDNELLPPCVSTNARESVGNVCQGEGEQLESAVTGDPGSQPLPQASGIRQDTDASVEVVSPSIKEPPNVPRRSNRERKPPAWMTSGEYVTNFQQTEDTAGPDLSLTCDQQMLLIKMLLSHVMPN